MALVLIAIAAAAACCALLWVYATSTFEPILAHLTIPLMIAFTLIVLGAQVVHWVSGPSSAQQALDVGLTIAWWVLLAIATIAGAITLWALVDQEVHHRGILWGRRKFPAEQPKG
ncbi:hypothetical protein [Leifsonia shinshuensis]